MDKKTVVNKKDCNEVSLAKICDELKAMSIESYRAGETGKNPFDHVRIMANIMCKEMTKVNKKRSK